VNSVANVDELLAVLAVGAGYWGLLANGGLVLGKCIEY